jgi:hypothetical protein
MKAYSVFDCKIAIPLSFIDNTKGEVDEYATGLPICLRETSLPCIFAAQTKKIMKKLFLMAALFTSVAALAQSNKEDVDFIQSIFGKEKKIIVNDFITLEGARKDAFWKLYDEYETKRKELGQKRIALLEKYAATYSTMDDAATSQIIKETIALGAANDKLISGYHKKMEKAAGFKAAAQFYQIEVYFLSEIRAAILENIPFIGQLD